VVGQGFVEIVAEIPSHAEAVGTDVFQLSLGSNTLEEHDKLELEEHDGVDGRTAGGRLTVAYQVTDKAQVQRTLDVAIEMVAGTRSSSETLTMG